MSSSLFLRFIAVMLIATGAAYADCTAPQGPRDIPNGKKATKEEMMSTHKAVQEFNDKTAEYTECTLRELEEAIAKKGDKITDKEKQKLQGRQAKKQNAAIERLEKVAERFNEQVRLFNARTAATDDAKKSGGS